MKKHFLLLVAALLTSSATHAALYDRGSGLIYDDVLNVTWLQDANYAKTSGYDTDGQMSWIGANGWAENLSYYDSERSVTYTDWRLPTTLQPDATCDNSNSQASYGFNCTGSELGHLFYEELGGMAGTSITAAHNANYSMFNNIQTGVYLSATPYSLSPSYVWGLFFNEGKQDIYTGTTDYFAWAVRDGDVTAVPEPETYAMMLAGLGMVGAMTRRRKQS